MSTEFRFPSYRLFPYERQLAFRELDRLGLAVAHSDIHRVVTDGRSTPYDLARLTYFGSVISDGTCIEPDVTVLERRHLERRATNGRVRQATRYSVHSFHEYKGKFHPHLVRAFANLIDVAPDELVVDPFCGSGTTLVESLLLGCDAVGVDLSPMATLISRAKIAALTDPDPSGLALRLKQWWESTSTAMASAQGSGRDVPVDGMPTASASYLRHWFTPPAYAALTVALRDLRVIRDDPALHLLTSVSLSTILRTVSLQVPEDLRIRRRPPGFVAPSLAQLARGASAEMAAAIRETAHLDLSHRLSQVVLGDVTAPGLLASIRGSASRVSVITSPPYATALPYIDTDRLSLVALGLVDPASTRALEAELIGSREWRREESKRWERRLDEDSDRLPESVLRLCRQIQLANADSAGFRRVAVPALLYRYFAAMAAAFRELRALLIPEEKAVFVVGVNRTGQGPTQVVIDTPILLGEIATQNGFALDEVLQLETWPRYGLHHENSVRGESALILRASQ